MQLPIRLMEQRDIEAVVQVHLAAFPNFFLTFLGSAFLRELYTAILRDSSGICFICEGRDGVARLCCRHRPTSGVLQASVHNAGGVFVRGRRPSNASPRHCSPVCSARFQCAREVQDSTLPNSALLMSIAIHPSLQGQHCGRYLVEAFLAEADRQGMDAVALDTDRDNNEQVNEFYRRCGFVLARSYITAQGRPMNEYVIQLNCISSREEAF